MRTSGSTPGGLFGLYRWVMSAARTGADPHLHRTITESCEPALALGCRFG